MSNHSANVKGDEHDDSYTTSTDDSDTSSSYSGSSGSSSASSSSRASPAPGGRSRASVIARTRTGTAANSAATASNGGVAGRRVRLNPSLRFERPDNEYIPLSPVRDTSQLTTMLRRILLDHERYPEGRYRMADYLRVSIEMFISQVRVEYTQQANSAKRSGRQLTRFLWKNKGELAICFACCCDMLKLFVDTLQPGPLKPTFDSFAHQLFILLISESRIPASVLPEQTYVTKYADWQKGGTRYGGEQVTANVRFPSALERRSKVETYLKSGSGYLIEAVTVDAPAPAASAQRGSTLYAPEAKLPVTARPAVAPGQAPSAKGPALLRPPARILSTKGSSGSTGASALPAASPTAPQAPAAMVGVKQMPESMQHLYWLSALAHVKGGSPTAGFPDERAQALPGLIRLCEVTERPEEMLMLAQLVAASTVSVQSVVERLGGIIAFRRFAAHLIRLGDGHSLVRLVKSIVDMKLSLWGSASQRAWRTTAAQKLTADLHWLRIEPCVPAEKRAVWGALLLVMEQRYLFKRAREELDPQSTKRYRRNADADVAYSSTDLRAAMIDNIDLQKWKMPRVHTLEAVRLPVSLRTPPLATALEGDSVQCMDSKQKYAGKAQQEWYHTLEEALKTNRVEPSEVTVPLWYDPYQLLGVDPIP